MTPITSLAALEWPVAGGYPAVPFGSFQVGRFVTALTIAPADSPVCATSEGDISFQFDGDKMPSGLPCTLGGFVAVQHPDGLISVYGRLEPGSLPLYLRTTVTGDILGRSGISGYYSSRESTFTLYDRVKRQYLNPQVLLPPKKDNKAPVVRLMQLAAEGKAFTLGETRTIRQGTYEVLADIQDPQIDTDSKPRAPYSIRLLIDGTERIRYSYDAARAETGKLRFFGSAKADFDSYFLADGKVRLGSFLFSHGRSTLVLVVTDYAGNEREISHIVAVE